MNTESSAAESAQLPPPARPRRWLTWLLALVIFVAGMASGAALTVHYAVNRLQFAIHHPEVAPARIAGIIQRRLDLSDQQRAEVEAVVAKRQVEIAAIRSKFQPEIVVQLDAVRNEVSEVLTEPQRARWTQLFDQFRERWLPAAPPHSDG